MRLKVAINYYSATGITHRLARAVMEGAEGAGVEVRLHHVRELAADEEIASNEAGRAIAPGRRTSPRPPTTTSSGPTR